MGNAMMGIDQQMLRNQPPAHEVVEQHSGRHGASLAGVDGRLVVTVPEVAIQPKVFISAEELLRDSFDLAIQVLRSGFEPTFLVGIWRGGAPIGISVQEVLEYNGIECDHISIRTSSYTGVDKQAESVRVHAIDYLVSQLTFEDRLLLIDDVFDSGRSLEAVVDELRRRCKRNLPDQIRIATVYYKPERNRTSIVPDYYVRATDRWLVFPHELEGLTREEILEHRPVDETFFTARQVKQ